MRCSFFFHQLHQLLLELGALSLIVNLIQFTFGEIVVQRLPDPDSMLLNAPYPLARTRHLGVFPMPWALRAWGICALNEAG